MTCELSKCLEKLRDVSKDDSKDDKALAEAYLDYLECRDKTPDSALVQRGLPQDNKLVERLAKIESNTDLWEKAVCKKADVYLTEALKSSTHKDRKEKIEDAMRLLAGLGEAAGPAVHLTLAKAYLYRSRIIRPKGWSVPENKKEAINKGLKALDKPISVTMGEAKVIKALLYLELDKVKEADENDLKKALEEALDGITNFTDAEYIKLAARYIEIETISDLSLVQRLVQRIIDSTVEGIELERAKAYDVLSKAPEAKKEMISVLRKLRKANFSHPLWDESACFLMKLYKSNKPIWKPLALLAWSTCQHVERNTLSPLHMRWYWSRMRDLYDLAFLAADTAKMKVKIADSLKSRPALRWQAWEEIAKSRDDLKYLIEKEADAYDGGYVTGFKEFKEKSKEQSGQALNNETRSRRNIDDVPKDWVVIHFYLNSLDGKGYAIIADCSKSQNWNIAVIAKNTLTDLFNTYMEWQTNYIQCKQKVPPQYLINLCAVIGVSMPFLFSQRSISKDAKVLFIPHDFLHRLPLHGAIEEKEANKAARVFLQEHVNCYLPAWSYVNENRASVGDASYLLRGPQEAHVAGKYVSVAFDTNLFAEINAIGEIGKNPKILAIACHGKADMTNPFNSRLVLEKNDGSHLQILQDAPSLNGTKVILGACEADFMSPTPRPLDEHLSIATALLNKNASEILGTMWNAYGPDADELTELIARCTKSIAQIVNEWHKEMIADFQSEPSKYYRAVLFRVTGAGLNS